MDGWMHAWRTVGQASRDVDACATLRTLGASRVAERLLLLTMDVRSLTRVVTEWMLMRGWQKGGGGCGRLRWMMRGLMWMR